MPGIGRPCPARPGPFPGLSIRLALSLLLFPAALAFTGCDRLDPACYGVPDAEARDTTVATYDSVRIQAIGRDACGSVLRFLWSFDGGETYDTTNAAFITRAFTRADIGEKKLRIRVLAGNGTLSAPATATITVVERFIPYHLPKDTIDYFADTSVAVDLTPADPTPGIEWYYLIKPSYPARTDSSRTPVFKVGMPRAYNSIERMYARFKLASGIRSDTTALVLQGRPRPFGTEGIIAAVLDGRSLRLIQSVRSDSAPVSPRSGQRIMNPRVMEMDFEGNILRDKIYPSARDIGVQRLSIHAGGSSLILGWDALANQDDLYIAAFDRGGGALWDEMLVLDSNYTQPIRAFSGTGGDYQVIATNSAAIGAGDGKPPSKYAVRIHFVELAPDGKMVSDNPVTVPDMYSQNILAERMKDGSVVLAGMLHDTAGVEQEDLLILDYDFSGRLLWSKTFRSEGGTSRAGSLDVLGDGSIYLTGTDYGYGSTAQLSYWILKLDEKGNQTDYRVTVFPKGYSPSGMARNDQGTVLRLLNGDAGGLLLAADLAGNEKWRRTVAKAYRSAYLESATALPDGSFLVSGSIYGDNTNGYRNQAFAFRITADGDFLW